MSLKKKLCRFGNGNLCNNFCLEINIICSEVTFQMTFLARFLSRKDIGVIVTFGCPSLDRKVVNSGKRLRAYAGIDEGNVGDDHFLQSFTFLYCIVHNFAFTYNKIFLAFNSLMCFNQVCSSCNLRGDCERAFVKAREDEGGRTVDVMRIILTYGLDPIIGSVDNKPSLNKMVKESVRRLLKKIVECGTEENPSTFPDITEDAVEEVHPNPLDKGKKDVPLKQGDWLCPKYRAFFLSSNHSL